MFTDSPALIFSALCLLMEYLYNNTMTHITDPIDALQVLALANYLSIVIEERHEPLLIHCK